MAAPTAQETAQASALQEQKAAERQTIAANTVGSAERQKKLAAAQQKRNQFRFKLIYLIVPALATAVWLLEFIDGGLIMGILSSTIIFMMRMIMLFFLPKAVKEFLLIQKKAHIQYFAQGLLSYVLSVINVDMFMAWWGVLITIPSEGRRIEKEEIRPLQAT